MLPLLTHDHARTNSTINTIYSHKRDRELLANVELLLIGSKRLTDYIPLESKLIGKGFDIVPYWPKSFTYLIGQKAFI